MTEQHEHPEWMKNTESGVILSVNRRSYPARGGRVDVIVVLVQGAINDYAAYAGSGDDDWVRRNGDKISFEEACVHFPGGQLVKERYRP